MCSRHQPENGADSQQSLEEWWWLTGVMERAIQNSPSTRPRPVLSPDRPLQVSKYPEEISEAPTAPGEAHRAFERG